MFYFKTGDDTIMIHHVTVFGFIILPEPMDVQSFKVTLDGFEVFDCGSVFRVDDDKDAISFTARGMHVCVAKDQTPGEVAFDIQATVPILLINSEEYAATAYTTITGSYCICPSTGLDPIFVANGGRVYG